MEVHLPPEVETKLVSLANQRGTNAHALARASLFQSHADQDSDPKAKN